MNASGSSTFPKITAAVLSALFVLSLGWLSYGNFQAGAQYWEIALSALLLAVPLALLYASAGILWTAARQRRESRQVSPRLDAYIHWMPRIAGILIIVFVSLFSLDVFTGETSFWQELGGFFIHSLPAIVMAILLAVAWRRPAVGFVAFLLAAIFFVRSALGNFPGGLGILLLFSGPMAAISALFWADWRWHPGAAKP